MTPAPDHGDPVFHDWHSTRSVPEFVDLLHPAEVQLVVDVRTVPRSRANPQFNRDTLPGRLAAYEIGYEHVAELGGLRGKQGLVEPSPNGFWENDSFRNYADYALTDAFRAGLACLRGLGAERRTAIMCAEAVWWRCHRRIITDYLLAAGEAVFHILGSDRIEQATMNPAARSVPGQGLVYPYGIRGASNRASEAPARSPPGASIVTTTAPGCALKPEG